MIYDKVQFGTINRCVNYPGVLVSGVLFNRLHCIASQKYRFMPKFIHAYILWTDNLNMILHTCTYKDVSEINVW